MITMLAEVLKNTLMVTSFVMVIMLFIEILNISTQGSWNKGLAKSPFMQVLVAAVLGLIPGCFGGFAAVSMFTHGLLNVGALMAAMITNVGDEAFVMLVQMPQATLWLMLILFALAIVVGLLCNRLIKKESPCVHNKKHYAIHDHSEESWNEMASHWKDHLKKMTFSRALLMFGIILFMAMLALGVFEHGASHEEGEAHTHSMELIEAGHSMEMTETEALTPSNLSDEGGFRLPLEETWFNAIFMVLAALVLITVVCVSDHFIEHHLWGHVIKQHFLKIFLWTFAALLLIHLMENWVGALTWINKNPLLILLIAVAVGLIPESGPHMVFIGLFVSGNIPFAILLANSIVQDGHSALPLFAESKKTFFLMKLGKAVLGFMLGWLLMVF